ncbi:ribosome small subunit-dependent GTPase A [Secundilactobacillus odoratitofui]|uniref:ribosome small subunit-dependent GTPase A n=1 Tax=Secundilactobacillus odoratitofui TaxID=480930 RepID=UPI002093E595|nr:ribosome small subunit-dependent GTPase A [Secundilactobacillus odoratitofui]
MTLGNFFAQVTGRIVNMAMDATDFPTVGDWVQVRLPQNAQDLATIERICNRQSVFLRKVAGRRFNAQLVAANVDWVLSCMALDANFNLRRLERYLAVANASGAQPAVVLTKADTTSTLINQVEAVKAITDAPVIVCDTSAAGIDTLATFIMPGMTYAFLGSSGVGKTTLINRLLGTQAYATNAVRISDNHGRHTTTARQLLRLPSGGIVIDTPGMRELGLLEADVTTTFSDIQALAVGCRFKDCTHTNEPGCAVQAAVGDGELNADRLTSYQQLIAEQATNNQLRGKARENEKINRMFGSKKLMKQKNESCAT